MRPTWPTKKVTWVTQIVRVICDVNQYMMKWSFNLLSYCLDSDFSISNIGKSQPKNWHYKFQHKIILADLNQYMTATCLVIILADDAIKHTCICPLASHLFSNFSPFHSPVKKKEKQWRMKGLIMIQWINLNQNNRYPY